MSYTTRQAQLSVAHAQEALRADHLKLHKLADAVQTAADQEALAAGLKELYTALLAHFSAEETPAGLYDALGVCVPEYREVVAQLVEEHRRISATLWGLSRRAEERMKYSFPELREEALRILAGMHDHEALEHNLAAEALMKKAVGAS